MSQKIMMNEDIYNSFIEELQAIDNVEKLCNEIDFKKNTITKNFNPSKFTKLLLTEIDRLSETCTILEKLKKVETIDEDVYDKLQNILEKLKDYRNYKIYEDFYKRIKNIEESFLKNKLGKGKNPCNKKRIFEQYVKLTDISDEDIDYDTISINRGCTNYKENIEKIKSQLKKLEKDIQSVKCDCKDEEKLLVCFNNLQNLSDECDKISIPNELSLLEAKRKDIKTIIIKKKDKCFEENDLEKEKKNKERKEKEDKERKRKEEIEKEEIKKKREVDIKKNIDNRLPIIDIEKNPCTKKHELALEWGKIQTDFNNDKDFVNKEYKVLIDNLIKSYENQCDKQKEDENKEEKARREQEEKALRAEQEEKARREQEEKARREQEEKARRADQEEKARREQEKKQSIEAQIKGIISTKDNLTNCEKLEKIKTITDIDKYPNIKIEFSNKCQIETELDSEITNKNCGKLLRGYESGDKNKTPYELFEDIVKERIADSTFSEDKDFNTIVQEKLQEIKNAYDECFEKKAEEKPEKKAEEKPEKKPSSLLSQLAEPDEEEKRERKQAKDEAQRQSEEEEERKREYDETKKREEERQAEDVKKKLEAERKKEEAKEQERQAQEKKQEEEQERKRKAEALINFEKDPCKKAKLLTNELNRQNTKQPNEQLTRLRTDCFDQRVKEERKKNETELQNFMTQLTNCKSKEQLEDQISKIENEIKEEIQKINKPLDENKDDDKKILDFLRDKYKQLNILKEICSTNSFSKCNQIKNENIKTHNLTQIDKLYNNILNEKDTEKRKKLLEELETKGINCDKFLNIKDDCNKYRFGKGVFKIEDNLNEYKEPCTKKEKDEITRENKAKKKKEEEARKREEEEERKAEVERQREEERKAEIERQREEEDKKRQEEEQKREDEKKKLEDEEAKKKKEAEKKQAEAEEAQTKRAEEDKKRKAEEEQRKRLEEEKKKRKEEAKKKEEEEQRQRVEEAQRKREETERKREEAQRKKDEEAKKRKEEAKKKEEEEQRQRVEEAQRKREETERKREEAQRKKDEAKKREDDEKAKKIEILKEKLSKFQNKSISDQIKEIKAEYYRIKTMSDDEIDFLSRMLESFISKVTSTKEVCEC